MTLNDAYAEYSARPGDDTLSALYRAATQRALAMARGFRCPDAENAAAGAVAHLWGKLESFDPAKAEFGVWFNTVVKNYLLNHRRSEQEFADEPDWDSEPVVTNAFHYPINSLDAPDEQKEMLEILIFTGNFHDTAAQLGITPKALRSRLERIKQSVREK